MKRRLFAIPESSDPKAQSAFRYATIIMWAAIVALPVEAYLALRTGAWQLWIGTALIAFIFAAALFSYRLIQIGNIENAARVLIFSVLIVVIANPFLIADIGVVLGLVAIVLTIEIASRTIERPVVFIFTSFVSAALT